MSIKRRIAKLEKQVPVAPDARKAAHRAFWAAFYEWFQEVLAPFPEALAEVRRRVAGNLCTWDSEAKPEVKLWVLSNTAWYALEEFPDAKEVADRAFALLEKEIQAASGMEEVASEETPAVPADGAWFEDERENSLAATEPPAARQPEGDGKGQVDGDSEPFFLDGF
jgi:hypothetical protein